MGFWGRGWGGKKVGREMWETGSEAKSGATVITDSLPDDPQRLPPASPTSTAVTKPKKQKSVC